jgi:hypothetical protein
MTDTPRDLIARLEARAALRSADAERLGHLKGKLVTCEYLLTITGAQESARIEASVLREAAALLRAEAEPNLKAQLLASQGQVAALRAALEEIVRVGRTDQVLVLRAFIDGRDQVVGVAQTAELAEQFKAHGADYLAARTYDAVPYIRRETVAIAESALASLDPDPVKGSQEQP